VAGGTAPGPLSCLGSWRRLLRPRELLNSFEELLRRLEELLHSPEQNVMTSRASVNGFGRLDRLESLVCSEFSKKSLDFTVSEELSDLFGHFEQLLCKFHEAIWQSLSSKSF
jgi:hypothetical protein